MKGSTNPPTPVRDRISENSAILLNVLASGLLAAVIYIGNSMVTGIADLNTKQEEQNAKLTDILLEISNVKGVNEHQNADIKKLEKWTESHNIRHDREVD